MQLHLCKKKRRSGMGEKNWQGSFSFYTLLHPLFKKKLLITYFDIYLKEK